MSPPDHSRAIPFVAVPTSSMSDPYSYRDEIIIREIVRVGRGSRFLTVSELATKGTDRLNLTDNAKRCLRIVGICMDTYAVSASELVDNVPEELVEEIVRDKAEA